MRVLILSFYYEPDLCAGSFRTTALVSALHERAPGDTKIDVVTTLPNRYSTYVRPAAETERTAGIEIWRIKLPTHRSDMLGQCRAFVRFARQAWKLVAKKEYDVVFATSSRLMTATLGALIARRKHVPLYLDIRDIFAETMKDVLPPLVSRPVFWLCSLVESWTMRRADRINLVSRGFEGYFRSRYGDRSFAWFTNGIDEEFLAVPPPCKEHVVQERATVLYAGNIGEGQALHNVLPGLAHALHSRARFVVIGDGGRRAALEAAIGHVDNVEMRPPVGRPELLRAYRAADVLFVHLGSQPAFERVLPSKVFEYAALGKPLLAGVAGYAAHFIREEIANAAVFEPGNVSDAVNAFESLKLTTHPRPEFIAKYARTNIANAMADDILQLCRADR
jgi:glycosyltransferase involved in cell wall biosynthesis